MTRDIHETLQELCNRMEMLEDEHDAIAKLPNEVAELSGKVDTLQTMLLARMDGVSTSVDKATSVKTAIQFAAVVVVPVLVALIGGYFALRAGLATPK